MPRPDTGPGNEPPGEFPNGDRAPWARSPLNPQVRALLDAADPDAPQPADLAGERAAYVDVALRLGGAAEPVAAVEQLVVPSGDARLRAALYTPQHESDTDALVVWLHGGGWYVGDIPGFDRVARSLANASGAKVLLPEYRLAPEHPFPTPTQDAVAVSRWARGDGAGQLAIDPASVVVAGDSAGGQLAAVAARHAVDDRLPPLRAQLLAYPALDPTMESASYREFADGPMLSAADMERCWAYYLDGRPADHDDADVLRAAPPGHLAPAAILVAGCDPLRDDGLRYADRLRDAGLSVSTAVFDDMAHGFLRWGGVVDRTREAVQWLGDATREALRR